MNMQVINFNNLEKFVTFLFINYNQQKSTNVNLQILTLTWKIC